MEKTIKSCYNKAKALELRLTRSSQNAYEVILAGMTVRLRPGCLNGVCDGGMEENYVELESGVYKVNTFNNLEQAESWYAGYKESYLD